MGGLEVGWTFYNATGQRLQTSATVLATQAEMETGTALTSFVTPGRTQYHPGVAKAWIARIEANGTLVQKSHNVSSVTDTGTGDRTVVWNTDFSDGEYSVASTIAGGGIGSTTGFHAYAANGTAGSSQIQIVDSSSGALADINHSVQAFGDQ